MALPQELLQIWSQVQKTDPFWRSLFLLKSIYSSPDRHQPRFLFYGYHSQTKQKHIVKFIQSTSDSLREVETVSKFSHPNIMGFDKVAHVQDWWVLCMKFAEKGDLVRLVHESGRLSENEARHIISQVLDVVEYLHYRGYAHRDIKLDNILLTESNHVYLTDFEFCEKYSKTHPFISQVGTFVYSSPELRFSSHSGLESDLWSVGVTLFCLVYGNLPFTTECLRLRQEEYYLKKYDAETKISKPCRDLIQKLLSTNPKKRYTARQALVHPWISPPITKSLDFDEPCFSLREKTLSQRPDAISFVQNTLKTKRERRRQSSLVPSNLSLSFH